MDDLETAGRVVVPGYEILEEPVADGRRVGRAGCREDGDSRRAEEVPGKMEADATARGAEEDPGAGHDPVGGLAGCVVWVRDWALVI